MGDRSNVQFIQHFEHEADKVLNLYSHYGGKEFQDGILATMQEFALTRLDDPSYFVRRVLARHIDDDETGMGIWFSPDDNEHPILQLIWDNHRSSVQVVYGGKNLATLDVYRDSEKMVRLKLQQVRDAVMAENAH